MHASQTSASPLLMGVHSRFFVLLLFVFFLFFLFWLVCFATGPLMIRYALKKKGKNSSLTFSRERLC